MSFSYDALNRQIFKDMPASPGNTNGTDLDVYSGYDGLGNLLYARFSSASGAGVSYHYDGLSRMDSVTDMFGRTITHAYDQTSNLTFLGLPEGCCNYYQYDAAGRLVYSDWSWTGVSLTQAYDVNGRLSSMSRPNSVVTTYLYDAIGRPTSLAQDLPGTAQDVQWTFTYNAAGQIKNQASSSGFYDYKEATVSSQSKTFDGLNRDAAIAALNGGYDSNGNLGTEGSGGRNFSYDIENRLIGMTGPATMTFQYDPIGRLAKVVDNGATTTYLYDGTNLMAEYDGTNTVIRRYLHTRGVDQPWVQLNGTGVSPGIASYLIDNYQGSVIALADGSTGAATELYKYGAYGEPYVASPSTPYTLTASFTGSRFRYTGQLTLADAKLYYYKARMYEPYMARFLQTDPIGSDADLDLYTYTLGDPINLNDPSGLAPITPQSTTGDDCPDPCEVTVTGKKKKKKDPLELWHKFTTYLKDRREHHYDVTNNICTAGVDTNCTTEAVYECLTKWPAPGATGSAVANGSTTNINVPLLVGGGVSHTASPGTGTVVNSTLPNHTLYPGYVIRQVVGSNSKGSMIGVESLGTGWGDHAAYNKLLAFPLWDIQSEDIRVCVTGTHRVY